MARLRLEEALEPRGRVGKMVVFDAKRKLRASQLNPVALVGESEDSDKLSLSKAAGDHIKRHGAKSAAMAFAWALKDAAPGEAELLRALNRAATF
jgi:hypothetical protein